VARQPDVPAAPLAKAARATPYAAAAATGPRADPVLSSARAARAAGRYEAPPGRNALDLYAAVLLARPDNAEARAGLAAVSATLLERATAAAHAGDEGEARRIAERVLGVDVRHAAARALLDRLERPAATVSTPAATAATPRPAAPRPAAAAAVPQRPPAPALRSATVRREDVPPDPLTPRIVGPGPTARPAAVAAQSGSQSRFGAPIASGHGVVGDSRQAATDSAPAAAHLPAPAGTDLAHASGPAARELTAIATPDPVYPAQAFRDRTEGWVEVEFTVSPQGATEDIVVVAAEPRGVFEAAASEAIAGWRYLPRVVNGRPVAQRASVTLQFSVED
jgi:protein TonB